MRILFLSLLVVSFPAFGETLQLEIHGFSKHLVNNYYTEETRTEYAMVYDPYLHMDKYQPVTTTTKTKYELNETNPGFGIVYKHLSAGFYKNSFSETSVYLAYHQEFSFSDNINYGFDVGTSRYSNYSSANTNLPDEYVPIFSPFVKAFNTKIQIMNFSVVAFSYSINLDI